MTREELEAYIEETYAAEPEHPWADEPLYTVYRHEANRKWFALLMDVPRCKLGLDGDEMISAVNLKCDPLLIGSMVGEPGIFPAYHMSRAHWITAALDGSAEEEKLKFLLEMSFDLTNVKRKAPKGR